MRVGYLQSKKMGRKMNFYWTWEIFGNINIGQHGDARFLMHNEVEWIQYSAHLRGLWCVHSHSHQLLRSNTSNTTEVTSLACFVNIGFEVAVILGDFKSSWRSRIWWWSQSMSYSQSLSSCFWSSSYNNPSLMQIGLLLRLEIRLIHWPIVNLG